MSDEEKKAIVELNHFSNMTAYWKQEEYANSEIDNYIKIVLNLIEKQQKEIEYKNKIIEKTFNDINSKNKKLAEILDNKNFIDEMWKDKIKAKIEDILNSENGEAIEKLIEWQSLLEKE